MNTISCLVHCFNSFLSVYGATIMSNPLKTNFYLANIVLNKGK